MSLEKMYRQLLNEGTGRKKKLKEDEPDKDLEKNEDADEDGDTIDEAEEPAADASKPDPNQAHGMEEDADEDELKEDADEDDKEVKTEGKKGKFPFKKFKKEDADEDEVKTEGKKKKLKKEDADEDELDEDATPPNAPEPDPSVMKADAGVDGEKPPLSEDADEDELKEDEEDEKAVNESIRKAMKKASAKVGTLFEGVELDAEHQLQVKSLFEAAIVERTKTIRKSLNDRFERKLSRARALHESVLLEAMDKFLGMAVADWMTQNKLAIEQGMGIELVESFMGGMKTLFEDHYVKVPEGKTDLLESMAKENDQMEVQLNEALLQVRDLTEQNTKFKKAQIVEQVGKGLTLSEKDRLSTLLEDVDFVDTKSFGKHAKTLMENMQKVSKVASDDEPEMLNEDVNASDRSDRNDPMNLYAKTLGKITNNKLS